LFSLSGKKEPTRASGFWNRFLGSVGFVLVHYLTNHTTGHARDSIRTQGSAEIKGTKKKADHVGVVAKVTALEAQNRREWTFGGTQ
jgi:hypothetical protein